MHNNGLYFSVFGLNTRKYGPEKNSLFGHFSCSVLLGSRAFQKRDWFLKKLRQVQIIFENVPGKPIFPPQIVSNLSNQNLNLKHDLILNNHWPMWHLKINVPISYLCIMFCSSNWILNWKKYSALLYLRIFRKGWIRNQIFFNKNLIIGFEFCFQLQDHIKLSSIRQDALRNLIPFAQFKKRKKH